MTNFCELARQREKPSSGLRQALESRAPILLFTRFSQGRLSSTTELRRKNPRVPCWRSSWTPLIINPCLCAAGKKISRRYRPISFPERARNLCRVWCQCAHGIAPLAADSVHAAGDGDHQKLTGAKDQLISGYRWHLLAWAASFCFQAEIASVLNLGVIFATPTHASPATRNLKNMTAWRRKWR